jgi:hypothetical protein
VEGAKRDKAGMACGHLQHIVIPHRGLGGVQGGGGDDKFHLRVLGRACQQTLHGTVSLAGEVVIVFDVVRRTEGNLFGEYVHMSIDDGHKRFLFMLTWK